MKNCPASVATRLAKWAGKIGPNLNSVNSGLTPDYLWAIISDPQSVLPHKLHAQNSHAGKLASADFQIFTPANDAANTAKRRIYHWSTTRLRCPVKIKYG
ncbi:MAG: hypothetical protein R3C26_13470 [Calditrichia bacterium]